MYGKLYWARRFVINEEYITKTQRLIDETTKSALPITAKEFELLYANQDMVHTLMEINIEIFKYLKDECSEPEMANAIAKITTPIMKG